MGCCGTNLYLVRLRKVERQQVKALVVQELQLGVEFLLFEAQHSVVSLDHQDQAPVAHHMLGSLPQPSTRFDQVFIEYILSSEPGEHSQS